MSHLMADLFAQPQGYGTAAHEQLTEYQKEQRELAVFTVGPAEKMCTDCHLIHRLAVPCDE